MSDFITQDAFTEYSHRMDAENERQNHRLSELEETVKKIQDLTVSVHEMSISLNTMTRELTKQGERLEKIEVKPAQSWDKLVWIIISALCSGVLGYILAMILK
jgi:hypothetical protein